MKKIFGFILVALSAFVLVACGGEQDDRIAITYAAWNLGNVEENNIERRLIQAWEEENPEYRIDLINRPVTVDPEGNEVETTWFDFFTTRAVDGALPDVYQLADVSTWIVNGWVEDIADLAATDADLALVPDDITDAARFDDYLFALPQAMFYVGYFVNRTVISEIPTPVAVNYGISFTDLFAAAQANSRFPRVGGDGIAGIDGVGSLYEWLPAQYDDSIGWFTYNEDGYHLNGDAFATAMAEVRKYYTSGAANNYWYVNEALEDDVRENYYGLGDPFSLGKQSIKWGPSYNMRGLIANTLDPSHALYQHDIDFIGTPSVGDVHRVPIILDYIALGRGTQHREVAYDFAKWMGYGIDGYRKRLEIAEAFPAAGAINFAPIVQDEDLISEYFELYPNMTEFQTLVTTHDAFIIESIGKTVPGYWQSRGSARYNEEYTISQMIARIIEGQAQLADVANGLNTAANNAFVAARQELEEALNRLG